MLDGLSRLPGGELVARGLADLRDGRSTVAACLVAIGGSRIRKAGLPVPADDALPLEPELRLYRLLCDEMGSAAYSHYNSLIRLLVSFEHALELQGKRPPQAANS
jgi:hypothetical protein